MRRFSRFFIPFALLAAALCAAENPANLSFLTQSFSFEPNMGQSASSALFLSHGPGYPAEIRQNGVTFKVSPVRSIRMNLLNALSNAALEGQSLLPGRVNYFPSPDRTQWHTSIPTYERVEEHNVYPGIDLVFYGNASHFEYDFLIQPNFNPAPLQVSFSGADRCSIDAQGSLVLQAGDRQLSLLKPVAYQFTKDGKSKEPVAASYRLNPESGAVSFDIGSYDHTRTLIIDPVLSFSEYLANPVNASAMDKAGNIYVVTGSAYGPSSITKLNAAGSVVYTTSFGSGLSPAAVAVDSSGNAYITGTALYNSTLPVSANAYSSAVPQNASAFLLKVSANGSSLPYGTYLGGVDNTETAASSIALDSSGNAYLAGYTQSATFPTTAGAYQTVNPPFTTSGFVSKFNPALSGKASLVYSTLIGSAQSAIPPVLNGIAVDASGDAYVTGHNAAGYPVTSGAFQYTGEDYLNGGVYVTKFNAGATALVYSAYLGYGTGNAIAVDGQGNAYVTGTVQYADFPVTAGAYQTIYPGGFVTKLNPAGSSEVFSTFLGGPSSQEAGFLGTGNVTPAGIALTPGCPAAAPSVINCSVYISGTTSTSDFPVINAIQTAWVPVNSSISAFVTELSSTGQSALLSTYLSGSGPAGAETTPGPFIAVDAAGNINLTGNLTNGYDGSFPVTVPPSATQTAAFFARIAPTGGPQLLPSPGSVSMGAPVGLNSSLVYETQQITLGNYGTSLVTISSIKISPAVFTETNNCGTTLAGGSSCVLSVTFTPIAAVQTSGTITIQSSASNGTLNIGLTGVGYNSDFLQASVQNLSFGDQAIQTSSKPQTFTLSNIGNTAVTPIISFDGPADFLVTNNCAQLASHASCSITVTFTPSQVGLRRGSVDIYDAPNSEVAYVNLYGTGTLPGVPASLIVTPSAVQLGPAPVGSTDNGSGTASLQITNTSAVPVTFQSIAAAGDFHISDNTCNPPVQLNPFAACYVFVEFTPTAAGVRTGTLTITDSVSSKPQIVPLSGTGLASSQNAEIYPASYLTAPNQPVGTTGPDQAITFQNTGTTPLAIYKVVTTGPFRVSSDTCTSTSVAGTKDDGTGVYSFCTVNVDFAPAAAGALTGTLTFYDSAPGSPHIVHLSGTGITATGTLTLSGNSLTFPTQAIGTSASMGISFSNPGDSPVQVTAITATGDFSQSLGTSCSALPFPVPAFTTLYCEWNVTFSPSAAGTRTGTLTVHSSAGLQTVALTGNGVAANFFRQMIPTGSMSFGSQVVGHSGNWQWVYFYHNKPASADPYPTLSVTGANAGDFSADGDIGCAEYTPNVSVCSAWMYFTPLAAGARTASVTFTDWAGTQTIKLTGTGLTATPQSSVSQSFITYAPPQTQGTISSALSVTFTNSSAASLPLGNVAVTSNFIILHGGDTCSGAAVAAGQSCSVQVEYAPALASPAANRLDSGTVTITNSSGKLLNSVGLAGYSMLPAYSALASQSEVNFAQQQALGFTSDYQTEISLLNTGNTAFTIGTVNGTNLGLAGSAAEFSVLPANQGADYCSGTTLQPGATCGVYVTFTPNVLGTSTGTLNFPVTYTNKTTATVPVKLSGVGIPVADQALLSPASVTFADLGVGTTSPASVVTLANTGNEPFTVGVLVGTNTVAGPTTSGEFSTYANDGCSRVTLNPGANCSIRITLTPGGTGTRSGSITFPLTFLDKKTMNQTLSLTGNGLSAVQQLQISPVPVFFNPAVQGNPNATVQQNITVTNTGDSPVTFGKDSISTGAADFQILYDPCASRTLAAGANCTILLRFSPAAASTGTRTGVLTIADNAGGPHAVPLSGNALTAPQQIELSQTSVTFGTQKAGTTSAPQVIYITNQGPQYISAPALLLGGKNAADFQLTDSCYYLGPSCSFSVVFAPQAGATGTRTATITETDTAPGSPRTITLTGTAN